MGFLEGFIFVVVVVSLAAGAAIGFLIGAIMASGRD